MLKEKVLPQTIYFKENRMIDTSKNWWWANDESRLFLSRGYIDGNMTVEERVREIAKTAENILDIPGFSDKFYHYMSRGFYSLFTYLFFAFTHFF